MKKEKKSKLVKKAKTNLQNIDRRQFASFLKAYYLQNKFPNKDFEIAYNNYNVFYFFRSGYVDILIDSTIILMYLFTFVNFIVFREYLENLNLNNFLIILISASICLVNLIFIILDRIFFFEENKNNSNDNTKARRFLKFIFRNGKIFLTNFYFIILFVFLRTRESRNMEDTSTQDTFYKYFFQNRLLYLNFIFTNALVFMNYTASIKVIVAYYIIMTIPLWISSINHDSLCSDVIDFGFSLFLTFLFYSLRKNFDLQTKKILDHKTDNQQKNKFKKYKTGFSNHSYLLKDLAYNNPSYGSCLSERLLLSCQQKDTLFHFNIYEKKLSHISQALGNFLLTNLNYKTENNKLNNNYSCNNKNINLKFANETFNYNFANDNNNKEKINGTNFSNKEINLNSQQKKCNKNDIFDSIVNQEKIKNNLNKLLTESFLFQKTNQTNKEKNNLFFSNLFKLNNEKAFDISFFLNNYNSIFYNTLTIEKKLILQKFARLSYDAEKSIKLSENELRDKIIQVIFTPRKNESLLSYINFIENFISKIFEFNLFQKQKTYFTDEISNNNNNNNDNIRKTHPDNNAAQNINYIIDDNEHDNSNLYGSPGNNLSYLDSQYSSDKKIILNKDYFKFSKSETNLNICINDYKESINKKVQNESLSNEQSSCQGYEKTDACLIEKNNVSHNINIDLPSSYLIEQINYNNIIKFPNILNENNQLNPEDTIQGQGLRKLSVETTNNDDARLHNDSKPENNSPAISIPDSKTEASGSFEKKFTFEFPSRNLINLGVYLLDIEQLDTKFEQNYFKESHGRFINLNNNNKNSKADTITDNLYSNCSSPYKNDLKKLKNSAYIYSERNNNTQQSEASDAKEADCSNHSGNAKNRKKLFFDVSLIINFIEDGSKSNFYLEIILQDVSKYYNSFNKIVKKNIEDYLNISKLIHEFKTPINCIVGLSNEIKDTIGSKQQDINEVKEDIDKIYNLSNYTVFLILDLMRFFSSKIKQEEKPIKRESTSNSPTSLENQSNVTNDAKKKYSVEPNLQNYPISEILKFSYSILTSLVKCSKIKKQNIIPSLKLPKIFEKINVLTDEIKLKQILLNLISNAVKFTHTGFIEIEGKFQDQLDRNAIEIIVKDSGIGINKNEQHKIFRDFSDIKISQNKNIENKMGTGLGLSLSKNIANLLGLDLFYDYGYSTGTKFSIIIPRSKFQIDSPKKVRKFDSAQLPRINFYNINPICVQAKDKEKDTIQYDNKNKKKTFNIHLQDFKKKLNSSFKYSNRFEEGNFKSNCLYSNLRWNIFNNKNTSTTNENTNNTNKSLDNSNIYSTRINSKQQRSKKLTYFEYNRKKFNLVDGTKEYNNSVTFSNYQNPNNSNNYSFTPKIFQRNQSLFHRIATNRQLIDSLYDVDNYFGYKEKKGFFDKRNNYGYNLDEIKSYNKINTFYNNNPTFNNHHSTSQDKEVCNYNAIVASNNNVSNNLNNTNNNSEFTSRTVTLSKNFNPNLNENLKSKVRIKKIKLYF